MCVWSRTIKSNYNMKFQKLIQDPSKHGSIIVQDTNIFLGGDSNFSHMSINSVIDKQNIYYSEQGKSENINLPNDTFVLIEFLPMNTNIKKRGQLSTVLKGKLELYAEYRQQGANLSGRKIKVIPISSKCKHIRSNYSKGYKHGQPVSMQAAEDYVKDELKIAQKQGYEGIWIVASIYCQRSFTIGKIYIVMLSYDAGNSGTTAQRMSRIASPYKNKNVGLVISNSFDSTRDEKIDLMLISRAKSRQKKTGEDFINAGRSVKRGLSIFSINDNGDLVQWTFDEYLTRLYRNKTSFDKFVSREITKFIVINGLEKIFKNGTKWKGATHEKLDNTFIEDDNALPSNKGVGNKIPTAQKDINNVLLVIQYMVQKAHIMYAIGSDGNNNSLTQSLQNVTMDSMLNLEFKSQFGLSAMDVLNLIKCEMEVEVLLEQVCRANIQYKQELAIKTVKDL